jgi:hypothetical protein
MNLVVAHSGLARFLRFFLVFSLVVSYWLTMPRTRPVYAAEEFADIGAALIGVERGHVAWGDFDNDGWLDLIVLGCYEFDCYSTAIQIYRNNGDNTFSDIHVDLPLVSFGSVAWGDYDNDGALDLIITGRDTFGGFARADIYHNDSAGVFRDIGAGLMGLQMGRSRGAITTTTVVLIW